VEKSILVIESCQGIRERLCRILGENFKILFVSTAFEGARMLSRNIGVVFLDLVLPDADGINVLKEIKTRYPSIPVIIITKHGGEEACQKSFENGAIDYINYARRPFNAEEIKTKVALLLNLQCSGGWAHRRPLFLESLTNSSDKAIPTIPSTILEGIMRAKKYIDEHYSTDLHISQMVKESAMNRTYFCNYFKIVTGLTFKDYLTSKRLLMAKELLRNDKLRIDEVAERVGYSSKHFFDVFKKSFGIPPKKSIN
jgi:YesN/AraC family two-component response regulator